jgi:uncharacterized protein
MKQRIIGFDLARAYAVFGMYIVNFNVVFGDTKDASLFGQFLSLFSGNSSTAFVMLSGMGLALMSSRIHKYTPQDRNRLRNTVLKRAGFLFVLGLLLSLWWPADILHFYGGYMCIAAFLLFANKNYHLLVACTAILIFHLLVLVIPFETGWNFDTLFYKDFWTIQGFFRNMFYNGWNPIFPWLAYFMIGLYLGRLDWASKIVQMKVFTIGFILFIFTTTIQVFSTQFTTDKDLLFFINADYLPPFLPFMLSTTGFDLMLIAGFMYLGMNISESKLAQDFAKTGQMTLTHYISHIVLGMILFSFIIEQTNIGQGSPKIIVAPIYIFSFACLYFVMSYFFSKFWLKKYKNGVFETLMRKISG